MAKEKQRLQLDLEELFPGDTLKIGNSTVIIQPLGTGQLAIVGKKIKTVIESLKDKGVTFDNYNEPENVLILADVIMEDAPDLLAEAANIDVEDLKLLPIPVTVQILDKVIEVNMKSKDSLMGNFKSLMGRFSQKKADSKPEKKSKSPESSKS